MFELTINDKYHVSDGDITITTDRRTVAEFICHLLNSDEDLRTVFGLPTEKADADKWLAADDRVTARYNWSY